MAYTFKATYYDKFFHVGIHYSYELHGNCLSQTECNAKEEIQGILFTL